MNQSPLRRMKNIYSFLIAMFVLLLASCAPTGMPTSAPPLPTPSMPSQPTAQLQHIDLGVGYIPNVQFAPLYVAQSKGFFAEQGLEVALEYGFENDFVALTGQGKRQFAVASGDQVVLARAQGLPIVYVARWYQRYPVGVMALAETGIDTPKKLEGRKVGTPVLFGASYVGWKALTYAAGLDEKTIQLEVIGFAQAEAISQKLVDAAVVYVANEPVQLRHAGKKVSVIEVSDYIDMVSNGIVTSEAMVREKPAMVRKLISGFLKGLEYTLAHPDEAFTIARQAVPEITDENAPVQRAVLEASLVLWRSDTLGTSNHQAWLDTVKAMQAAGMIPSPPDVDKLYTNQFVQ